MSLTLSKSIVVVAACTMAAGLILLGYGVGAKSRNGQDSSKKNGRPESKGEKTESKWNPALGNIVIIAPELGFSVAGLKEQNGREARFSKAIENQLMGLRQIYQVEVEKKPALMGSILLQLAVAPSGNVTQAKELRSHLIDYDFKKMILAEVSKWKFPEMSSDAARINCPLLFVREGMDINTLIQWEKALNFFEEQASLAQNGNQGKAPANAGYSLAAARHEQGDAEAKHDLDPARQRQQKSATRTVVEVYELRSAATVRKQPSFAASSLARVAPGTKVKVVGVRGDWLEIRSREGDPAGFIRKEFATPIDKAKK